MFHFSRSPEGVVIDGSCGFWKRWWPLGLAVLIVGLFFTMFDVSVVFRPQISALWTNKELLATDEELMDLVVPKGGVDLEVEWGDLGKRMVEAGVIDREQFAEVYERRGGLSEEAKAWLDGGDNGSLRVTKENAPVLLNLLWAFGLANKNSVLDEGEMMDPQYGGAGKFASTGGWSLSTGDSMDHYSKHEFVALTAEQQALVDEVSRGIYRPCCNNSTHFPDCNHGMAMLGFLELMASQGFSKEEMYRKALALNSFWFEDTYVTIAKLLQIQGVAWSDGDARVLLGKEFSSSSGYRNVLSLVDPEPQGGGGGGCGV